MQRTSSQPNRHDQWTATDGLVLRNVSHRFGEAVVVDDVSLTVRRGEIACLLGPSGCGKTTSLRIAAGLEALQSGSVLIDQETVADPGEDTPPEQRNIGMVFQDYALFPHLTVLENITFGLSHAQRKDGFEVVHGLLRRLSIERFADVYPHVLSGGEQQRVALARALAPQPSVMLMDEPFANLDVRLRDRIRDDTMAMLRETGTATLMVTHDPDEAMRLADQIVLMRAGRIVQAGTSEDFTRRPCNHFSATFFRESNDLRGIVAAPGEIESDIGRFPANTGDLAVGTPADIVIRPEGIRLTDPAGPLRGLVLSARVVGAFGLVDLDVGTSKRPMRAYVFAGDLPPTGAEIALSLDADQIFVFPDSSH